MLAINAKIFGSKDHSRHNGVREGSFGSLIDERNRLGTRHLIVILADPSLPALLAQVEPCVPVSTMTTFGLQSSDSLRLEIVSTSGRISCGNLERHNHRRP